MKTKIFLTVIFLLMFGLSQNSNSESPPVISGPFGSKPIQLSFGANGIQQNKTPGFICELDASLGGGHYSEWGETEEDARTLVTKKCGDKSGLLLCKRDNATCKQEK